MFYPTPRFRVRWRGRGRGERKEELRDVLVMAFKKEHEPQIIGMSGGGPKKEVNEKDVQPVVF